ncbi:MAG: efflux RND transporter periplasmic adaptor subunit [Phycisphaeraceae bacterium]|nr:efflux RND transporter periplasmic adaptor subunit [Phycisphaeraceae bacterium]
MRGIWLWLFVPVLALYQPSTAAPGSDSVNEPRASASGALSSAPGSAGGYDGSNSAPADARYQTDRLEGLALPVKQVTLNGPMSGILAELLVEEGDRVEEGSVLARMDDRLQQATVMGAQLQAESETEIRKSELARDDAQITLERSEEARAADAASDWEVRRARLQRDHAQATLEQAQEQKELAKVKLKLEEERLSLFYVKAPFSGRIVRLFSEAGVTLTTDDKMLAMAKIDELEAQIFLPVDFYGKLTIGQDYSLKAMEPVNQTLSGKLKTVDPIIDPASRTFRCVFTINNKDESLPAGFAVRLLWNTPPPATPGSSPAPPGSDVLNEPRTSASEASSPAAESSPAAGSESAPASASDAAPGDSAASETETTSDSGNAP